MGGPNSPASGKPSPDSAFGDASHEGGYKPPKIWETKPLKIQETWGTPWNIHWANLGLNKSTSCGIHVSRCNACMMWSSLCSLNRLKKMVRAIIMNTASYHLLLNINFLSTYPQHASMPAWNHWSAAGISRHLSAGTHLPQDFSFIKGLSGIAEPFYIS